MRVGNIARWINANSSDVWNEMYRADGRYDVVVFAKAMDRACQEEAKRIQSSGGKVVFDANVNYYETWGDYDIPGTRPTVQLQQDAIAMTTLADWVVADSSYLLEVIKRFTPRVTWIPDNVDLGVYAGVRHHKSDGMTRVVWSGIAKKAQPLILIRDALGSLRDIEFVLVSDERPEVMRSLQSAVPCRFIRFGDRRYAHVLLTCDIIVSPKRLINAYEMGHTEYKITLGMAVGLPAVASPQQSYVEAISYKGGGIIAGTSDEWRDSLVMLVKDPQLRADLGTKARQTVLDRYATPVVAREYLDLLRSLA